MAQPPRAAIPLPVDPHTNAWDKKVQELADKGFFVSTIASLTGLTASQVSYRLHKFGMSTLDYRRGSSPAATKLISHIDQMLGDVKQLRSEIDKMLSSRRRKRRKAV
jgi:predicted transcriptional regulator